MKNKKTEILSAFVIVLLVVLLAVIIFAPLMYAEEYPLPQVGDTVATITWGKLQDVPIVWGLSLIHISEPTRLEYLSRMPSSA